MNAARFSKEIVVRDPDTYAEVTLLLYKHEDGGMFAIDKHYADQLPRAYKDPEDKRVVAMDPLSDPYTEHKTMNFVILED